MTEAPYYTGDEKPLKFEVTDANGVVNITSSIVKILKPNNSETEGVEAAVDGNVVSYNVPGSVNSVPGAYTAHFVNILPSGGERTHKIRYKVEANPGR